MKTGGHNKKTTEAHRLAGTFRADRADRHAGRVVGVGPIGPKLLTTSAGTSSRTPKAPAGLSDASCLLWKRIHKEYSITSAPSLELLISALRSLDVAEQARRTLEADGLSYTDSGGAPKVHPLAAVHRDARAQFVTTMRVLGFPSEDK